MTIYPTLAQTCPEPCRRIAPRIANPVTHLHGLTEAEFAHILTTFPLVAEAVKVAASIHAAMWKGGW